MRHYQPYLDEIRDLIARAKRGQSPRADGGSDIPGQFAQLQELHQSGALSPEEVETAKKRVLGTDG